jgi:putative phosphoribosyl transferase
MERRYRNRREAGEVLAGALSRYAGDDVTVIALPRGGVPVAAVVAEALGAPLDVLVIRKLGFPGQEELAMGAIASGGVRIMNERVLRTHHVDAGAIERVEGREAEELRRRERAYRGDAAFPELKGRTVILVDDGMATGSSMMVAVEAIRRHHPARVVVAVPVAPPDNVAKLRTLADAVICPSMPPGFVSISQWYDVFDQTSDAEVQSILAATRPGRASP